MGHYHADDAAVPSGRGRRNGQKIVPQRPGWSRVSAALPDAVEVLALSLQLRPQGAGGLVVVEPGGVADDHVDLTAGEGDGAHEVAGVVGPDVVAALLVESLERVDGPLPGFPFR